MLDTVRWRGYVPPYSTVMPKWRPVLSVTAAPQAVTPAKAGVQLKLPSSSLHARKLDSRLRGNDGIEKQKPTVSQRHPLNRRTQ